MTDTEKEHTPLNTERRTANAEGDARLQPSALIVQRSEEEHTPGLIHLDGLTIDLDDYCITYPDGTTMLLSGLEELLLRTLINAAGRIVTMEELGRQVWGWERAYSASAIWSCVSSVRYKLGDQPFRPRFIQNVRGRGYRIRLRLLPETIGQSRNRREAIEQAGPESEPAHEAAPKPTPTPRRKE